VIIGIDDYSGPTDWFQPVGKTVLDRDWSDLLGAVRDAEAIHELLTQSYGFPPENVRLLRNREATREAILRTITETLTRPAVRGDQLVLYYAGHGSQVPNSLSTEPDRLDESLVPADARSGAADIRDKELRRALYPAVARGAHLTIILDSCHSASGVRGIPIAGQRRGIQPSPHDASEATTTEPLEKIGAIVVSAAQDFQSAWEVDDNEGKTRGAFTWSLLKAIRRAGQGASAADLFESARAILAATKPGQEPVLAGTNTARNRALFGEPLPHRPGGRVAAIETLLKGGRVALSAGWIHGLTVGSRLTESSTTDGIVLEVTTLRGLTGAEATVLRDDELLLPERLHIGQRFSFQGHRPSPPSPLRVWVPEETQHTAAAIFAVQEKLRQQGIGWSFDPLRGEPSTHLITWNRTGWTLQTSSNADTWALGESLSAEAVTRRISGLRSETRVFLDFPPRQDLASALRAELHQTPGIELTPNRSHADYVLIGRIDRVGLAQYSWVRPGVSGADQVRSPIPIASRWRASDPATPTKTINRLVEDAGGLARVLAWLQIEPPPSRATLPFELGLVGPAPKTPFIRTGRLLEGKEYKLSLRERSTATLAERYYVYLFSIDSSGRCESHFPLPWQGSVENYLPHPIPSHEAAHGKATRKDQPWTFEAPQPLRIASPLGIDSFYLLATEEPISDSGIFRCPGARAQRSGQEAPNSPLSALFPGSPETSRSATSLETPEVWFLERVSFLSVPAKEARQPGL